MAKYIIRKDNKGDYYWILWSSNNNKTVAMSSESYESKQGAKNSIEWVRKNAPDANLVDEA